MDALKLPVPSRTELFYAGVACVFPVFAWSTVQMLREVPAWALRLDAWDLVGMIAYNQAFTLFESGLVFLSLLLLSMLIPARWFRDKFHSLAAGIVYSSSLWFILVHYNDETIRLWGVRQFFLGGLVYLASLVVVYFLIQRIYRVEQLVSSFTRRLSVLSIVYGMVGLAGLLIMIIRNLS